MEASLDDLKKDLGVDACISRLREIMEERAKTVVIDTFLEYELLKHGFCVLSH